DVFRTDAPHGARTRSDRQRPTPCELMQLFVQCRTPLVLPCRIPVEVGAARMALSRETRRFQLNAIKEDLRLLRAPRGGATLCSTVRSLVWWLGSPASQRRSS